jgi:hypothetical protein
MNFLVTLYALNPEPFLNRCGVFPFEYSLIIDIVLLSLLPHAYGDNDTSLVILYSSQWDVFLFLLGFKTLSIYMSQLLKGAGLCLIILFMGV